jgi:integral membrane protein
VRRLFTTYRVLAIVVGILLAFGTFVAIPLRYLTTEGSDLQELGETLSLVWVLHGWIYMVYLVVAFLFARRCRWSLPFTLLMLVAGLVPILIFWVEHRVVQRTRVEHPELVSG